MGIKVKEIRFHKLKRLTDVVLTLPEMGLVALMGENGTGKTTILHALACIYKQGTGPRAPKEVYRWRDYFIPHTGNDWTGSSLDVLFNGDAAPITFQCVGNAWSPQNRRSRAIKLLLLSDCAPHIEREIGSRRFLSEDAPELEAISFSDVEGGRLTEEERSQLIAHMGKILGRRYELIKHVKKDNGVTEFFYAHCCIPANADPIRYPSHFMGAGEQRVCQILEEVISAPADALIIIEELEVSLYEAATKELIEVLSYYANTKRLQIVFSTHWTGIKELQGKVHIRSLKNRGARVEISEGADAELINNLANRHDKKYRPIEVWVEDDVAGAIVTKLTDELRMSKYVQIYTFGSIKNSFSVAAAKALQGAKTDSCIIVLDGDVYSSGDDQQGELQRSLTGGGDEIGKARRQALTYLTQFKAEGARSPEGFLLYAARRAIAEGKGNSFIRQKMSEADQEHIAGGPKDVLAFMADNTRRRTSVIDSLVECAAQSDIWAEYVSEIRVRLLNAGKAHSIPGIPNEV
ncbi:AAA family ATPase [Azospirillum argentinense]